MSKTPNRPQTPELLARAEKKRIAAFEGVAAIADFEKQAIAVRSNMERLRALRLAREAEQRAEEAANPPPPKVKASKTKAKKTAKAKPAGRAKVAAVDEPVDEPASD